MLSTPILSIGITQYIFLLVSHSHQNHLCIYIINLYTQAYIREFLFSTLLVYDNVFNDSLVNRYSNHFNPFLTFLFALFLHCIHVCLFTIEQAILNNHQQCLHKHCARGDLFLSLLSHKVGPFMFAASLALALRTFSVISHKNTSESF